MAPLSSDWRTEVMPATGNRRVNALQPRDTRVRGVSSIAERLERGTISSSPCAVENGARDYCQNISHWDGSRRRLVPRSQIRAELVNIVPRSNLPSMLPATLTRVSLGCSYQRPPVYLWVAVISAHPCISGLQLSVPTRVSLGCSCGCRAVPFEFTQPAGTAPTAIRARTRSRPPLHARARHR
jgi:hypothetical protein